MRRRRGAFAVGLAAALALSACGGGGGTSRSTTPPPAGSAAAPSRFAPTGCPTYNGRGCAPAGRRVDLADPKFSHSTRITNPLFPIGRLRSVVLLGHVDRKPFRTETTLLPGSSTVTWNGHRIKVLVSQYVAYLGGRLEEVALDRYAQADDGSVWYLGEDVMDYRRGTVAFTEGTWLAGREGPAAMIMPARPKVGDAYRVENVPGVVFEEVTIRSVGHAVAGPRGRVAGAVVGDELHIDGTYDHKTFAPRYGEFRTSGGGDVEALALAVPADALPGPPSAQLESLSTSATAILESARLLDWEAVQTTLTRMNGAWKAVQGADSPPPMIAARLSDSMRALARAVRTRRTQPVAQAAIDVAQSTLDLKLQHRPQPEIDAARFDLWAQQLRVHAAARDADRVAGDVAVLEWVRDRFVPTLDASARDDINRRLSVLRAATDARNLPAAADHAARLQGRLRAL